MERKHFEEVWRKLVIRAWNDPELKRQLKEEPNRVLAAAGLELPPGITFVVVENEPSRVHLVLPAQPQAAGALSDDAFSLAEYNAAY
jgi:hypothetical protein